MPETRQALKAYTDDIEAKREYQQNYKRKRREQSNPPPSQSADYAKKY